MDNNELSQFDKIILGLQIFRRIDPNDQVRASHDMLHCSAYHKRISKEDSEELKALGWEKRGDFDSWCFYV